MSHSQDMIFTLYGDYIRYRGGEAWTGSLIELLSHFDLSSQAVRSTLSRMSRKGWLTGRRVGRNSFYSLTPKCRVLLEEGAKRIFQPRSDPWDGRWHLLFYSIPESKRHLRRKLRRQLLWLGFGTLDNGTWITPRDLRPDVEEVVDALNLRPYVEFFSGQHRDFSSEGEIVARSWDLESLNQSYAALIAHYDPLLQEFKSRLQSVDGLDPAQCFFHRFLLIHEYRSSPYVDPNLPLELLPDEWQGEEATKLFQELHELLVDGAEEYVDAVLAKAPEVNA